MKVLYCVEEQLLVHLPVHYTRTELCENYCMEEGPFPTLAPAKVVTKVPKRGGGRNRPPIYSEGHARSRTLMNHQRKKERENTTCMHVIFGST